MTMLSTNEIINNLRLQRSRLEDKIRAVEVLLQDVCEDYGKEICQEGVCDCDPNGWEGCLTRKILEILEADK